MRLTEVEDVKGFMGKLLIKSEFDTFNLIEMEIMTSHKLTIDGKLNKQWFSGEELENIKEQEYITWKEIKNVAYEAIKGSQTPSYIKIVMAFSGEKVYKMAQKMNITQHIEDVGALYLNIKYENENLSLTTAVSYNNFTMDKSLEKEWDNYIEKIYG